MHSLTEIENSIKKSHSCSISGEFVSESNFEFICQIITQNKNIESLTLTKFNQEQFKKLSTSIIKNHNIEALTLDLCNMNKETCRIFSQCLKFQPNKFRIIRFMRSDFDHGFHFFAKALQKNYNLKEIYLQNLTQEFLPVEKENENEKENEKEKENSKNDPKNKSLSSLPSFNNKNVDELIRLLANVNLLSFSLINTIENSQHLLAITKTCLKNQSKLQSLCLNGSFFEQKELNQVIDFLMESQKELKIKSSHFKHICLSNLSKISKETLSLLPLFLQVNSIQELDILGNALSEEQLVSFTNHLSKNQSLKVFKFTLNSGIPEKIVSQFFSTLKQHKEIRNLVISGNLSEYTSFIGNMLADNFNIETLNLSNANLTSQSIKNFLSIFPTSKTIQEVSKNDLQNNENITNENKNENHDSDFDLEDDNQQNQNNQQNQQNQQNQNNQNNQQNEKNQQNQNNQQNEPKFMLKTLILSQNPNIGNDGAIEVLKLISQNKFLETLDLSNCGIDDDKLKDIFDYLSQCRYLVALFILRNNISLNLLGALESFIMSNTFLKRFYIDMGLKNELITTENENSLLRALKWNHSLERFIIFWKGQISITFEMNSAPHLQFNRERQVVNSPLTKGLLRLFKTQQFCDIKITDNIQAHKSILFARLFQFLSKNNQILNQPQTTKKQKKKQKHLDQEPPLKIKISDLDFSSIVKFLKSKNHETIIHLMNWIYGGVIPQEESPDINEELYSIEKEFSIAFTKKSLQQKLLANSGKKHEKAIIQLEFEEDIRKLYKAEPNFTIVLNSENIGVHLEIITAVSRKISVHVLRTNSKVFNDLTPAKPTQLKSFIEFLYHYQLSNFNVGLADYFFHALNYYEIENQILSQIITKKLDFIINEKNVDNILSLAEKHHSDSLEKLAKDFLAQSMSEWIFLENDTQKMNEIELSLKSKKKCVCF